MQLLPGAREVFANSSNFCSYLKKARSCFNIRRATTSSNTQKHAKDRTRRRNAFSRPHKQPALAWERNAFAMRLQAHLACSWEAFQFGDHPQCMCRRECIQKVNNLFAPGRKGARGNAFSSPFKCMLECGKLREGSQLLYSQSLLSPAPGFRGAAWVSNMTCTDMRAV